MTFQVLIVKFTIVILWQAVNLIRSRKMPAPQVIINPRMDYAVLLLAASATGYAAPRVFTYLL